MPKANNVGVKCCYLLRHSNFLRLYLYTFKSDDMCSLQLLKSSLYEIEKK